jgi:hypothetical protein
VESVVVHKAEAPTAPGAWHPDPTGRYESSPEVDGVTGRYYEDCAEAPVIHEREGHTGGVAPYVLDRDNADRLWQISEELTR